MTCSIKWSRDRRCHVTMSRGPPPPKGAVRQYGRLS